VAVEQYGAGPFGTLYLADLGADVIKIEDPSSGGDIARYVPPGQKGRDSLFFETFNRGKRSLALDLKNPASREVLARLVRGANAVFSNLRGDLPEQLGLTYAQLAPINPAVVCVSLSAYGRSNDRAAFPGYDALIQAEAGWASLTGEPDGPPVKSGLSLVDYAGGLLAALALMIGIFDARRTGRGRDIDTSLYDSALALLTYPATWYLTDSILVERLGLSAHPSLVPFQFFRTADGYLAVACPKEKFARTLLEEMGLSSDPRFASFDSRRLNREELVRMLTARFAERTTEEWLGVFLGRVPVAPIRSLASALDREELSARDMLASYPHRTFGTVQSVGTPLKFDGFSPTFAQAPALGGDRQRILEELGYDADEIEALAATGAFGQQGASSKDGMDGKN
jgi:crotonobetainyl-CoA:carnitine CoA-transferase CaiB-like acyl-CoA transferase